MAKPRISILMILPPLIFAALAGLFLYGMVREDPDALPSTRIGQQAPAMTVTPLGDSAPFTDADLQAPGVKLVNFWASWCGPCRAEHPILERLSDEGVTIYGINYKDEPEKALRFLEELGDPYAAIVADGTGRTALEWGVYGVPETFVIDGSGKVILRFAGPMTTQVLEKTIRPAMVAAR
ncbi:MAG: DsbE family thiol:disulfide interchange protein [Pseudomonadota bacterium]|uniref:Cytochrome c biogenesis protein CcmG/thiol:disulfide interchange protein DsbE n=2 Tax=Roseobacteraceae TaxID=2854170 RepID=A0A840CNP1_9RHOB|nr:cytochrome c biogenesis protein CcmG/thiol:disulfide interchange protein DsbE [Actibacterium naphthalenivorans]MDY6860290.1 DsbE family thiol:disulfide interchange protein [Pseudomonadota bacterium]